MSHLQTRAEQLRTAGRLPLYGYKNAIVEADKADGVLIQLGEQPSGRYLYMPDLDSHTAGQDADAARAAFERAEPEIARKLPWVRSESGRGWHVFFESPRRLPTGKLLEGDRHIGELLGDNSHTRDPGDLEIPTLTLSEIERIQAFWTIQGGDVGGERWSDRAKQGERWARGYKPVKRAELRIFLQNECGRVGKHLDVLFDQREPFNRSDTAGNLMQTLMLFAHKLPCGRESSFVEKCRTVMGYWAAADSYGKASEKGYSQEKDGFSLIAQIVNGDTKQSGKKWIPPYWTKGQASATPAARPEPAPEPRRPAHRPIGDREKQIKRLRRLLERRALDYYGKIPYYVDDLALELGVSRRSVQNYLQAMVDANLIERGQDQTGPGARAWLILLPAFWGANNSENAAENAQESAQIWGENEIADQRTPVPQNADRASQCKEGDHHNSCAPAPRPAAAGRPVGAQACGDPPLAPASAASPAFWVGGASYDPRRDWTTERGRLDLASWRDPREIHVPSGWIDRAPPQVPRPRRQRRQQGQQSFIGRDQGIAQRFARRKRHGEAPVPYRVPVPLPEEPFPDLYSHEGA